MSDQIDQTSEDFDPFENLTFDTKPVEFPPYLGIIVRDERAKSVFNNEINHQWVYAVRPVDIALGGKTGAWTGFVKINTKQNTVLMRLIPSFVQVFGKKDENGVNYSPGSGQLLGKVAWFQNKGFDFGPKMSQSKPVPIPVKAATAEEVERAMALPPYVPQASSDTTGETSTATTSFSEEQIQSAILLYDGQSHKDVIKTVVKDTDLDPAFKAGIQSGLLLNELVSRGLIEKDADGVFHVLVAA